MPTKPQDDALRNQLLAALPDSEFQKIRPGLEYVEFENGDVLWEAETKRKHIYFPTTTLICLLYDSDSGVSVEVGITGRQGLVGVTTFMTEASMATRAVAYRKGGAYRMSIKAVKNEFSACGDFQAVCMCFTQTMIAQLSQTAICNRLHSVEQQLCRFLLYAHDHDESDVIYLTHEQIAQALGVRRETVSVSASSLQENKVIEYSRGRITIKDRKRLLNFACECYSVETAHYNRVLAECLATQK